ncbi:MAG: copper homeostasis protein CutC [Sediminibacterium sp.]|jgi:copper homeostasis protein|nr:MAG: copper homeostasis protein CutC [Sediminibacterium sp.]
MSTKLEIAVFSVEAAVTALKAGAHRIEFCENPQEGGTTPSYGSLKTLRSYTTQPVFPIIRPRGGDFLYSRSEFEVMKADLLIVKELGYLGAVIGLLNADGSIDTNRTKELVNIAGPTMQISFHRAFDRCNDPLIALEEIIETGCKRILTSGQVPNAADALPLLKKLVEQSGDRIIIMPGSGVRSNNIKEIIQATAAKEIHSSARQMHASKMSYTKDSMKENLQATGVDADEIKKILEQLQA